MATMKGKRVLTSLYLDPEVADELKRLSAETGVPQAVYLREAVDLLLAHHRRFQDLLRNPRNEPVPVPAPPLLERYIRAASLIEARAVTPRNKKTKTEAAKHK